MSTSTLAPPAVLPDPIAQARAHRRTVRALVLTQVAGGAGLAAGITVAALIAVDLGGSTSVSGLPEAFAVAGTAGSTMPLALLMQRRGRRAGLRLGWVGGAVGALGVVAAAMAGSLVLLLVSMLVLGTAQASSDAARHVAADLATERTAGRAIGTVVAATAVSTALGPVLTGPSSGFAGRLGLVPMTGPFVLAVAAFLAAAVVVTVTLRPDPLLLVGRGPVPSAAVEEPAPGRPRLRALIRHRDVRLATTATAIANACMLGLMVLAPIHLHAGAADHADQLATIGPVISLHVAAMFAPSPLTGRVVDRFGPRRVVAGGAVLLAMAGLVSAAAAPADVTLLTAGLVLLGVGWNACFVAGASLVAAAVDPHDRPRAQGIVDTVAAGSAMAAGAAAGVVAHVAGHAAAGVIVAVAASVLAIASITKRRRTLPATGS